MFSVWKQRGLDLLRDGTEASDSQIFEKSEREYIKVLIVVISVCQEYGWF